MAFHPKRPSHRHVPIPSDEDWKAICDLFGIQSNLDLEKTVKLATYLQDIDRARMKMKSEEQEELLRLDRRARSLALRRVHGDLHEPLLPPNSLTDLEAVPALINLDYSRLCTWYIQKLIGQIHSWGVDGTAEEREKARELAQMAGNAIVMSAGRGRPPYAVAPEEALCAHNSDLERAKNVWKSFVSARRGLRRDVLVHEFADYPERVIPSEDFLCSDQATRNGVTLAITARRFGFSVRHLEDLLAKARRARTSLGK